MTEVSNSLNLVTNCTYHLPFFHFFFEVHCFEHSPIFGFLSCSNMSISCFSFFFNLFSGIFFIVFLILLQGTIEIQIVSLILIFERSTAQGRKRTRQHWVGKRGATSGSARPRSMAPGLAGQAWPSRACVFHRLHWCEMEKQKVEQREGNKRMGAHLLRKQHLSIQLDHSLTTRPTTRHTSTGWRSDVVSPGNDVTPLGPGRIPTVHRCSKEEAQQHTKTLA